MNDLLSISVLKLTLITIYICNIPLVVLAKNSRHVPLFFGCTLILVGKKIVIESSDKFNYLIMFSSPFLQVSLVSDFPDDSDLSLNLPRCICLTPQDVYSPFFRSGSKYKAWAPAAAMLLSVLPTCAK